MKGVRYIWALLLALTLSFGVDAQSVRNSIRTEVMLDSAGTRKLTTVRYFDGLGRAVQDVAVGVSPSGADIVRHSSRDRAGRIIREFNAVPSTGSGAFVPEADVLSLAKAAYADASPYRHTVYEQSPLGRELSVTGAGQSWHGAGKSAVKTYLANSSSERQLKCRLFEVTDRRLVTDTAVTVIPKGFYETGTLYVEKTVDEDGHASLVFTNKQGRVVLARSQIGDDYADTYYIYDITGRLTAVLPPALSATVSNTPLLSSSAKASGLGYFYIYDWLGHCRARKLPGAAWQVIRLDGGGKAMFSQDGNLTWLRRYGLSDVVTNFGQQTVYYGDIDVLTLDYSGNRLRSVSDAAGALTYAGAMDFRDGADSDTEYTYDANGNLTSDANKGITAITYNVLNLPEAVTFADGHRTRYTYTADGQKLRTEYCLVSTGLIGGGGRFEEADSVDGSLFSPFALTRPSLESIGHSKPPSIESITLTARNYCGPHIYLNGRHERLLTDCGYIQSGEPHYYVKDYQGNVRAVLNSAGATVETNSYYPYGALMATTDTRSTQPYKYGAKELDRENGLNLYDSHARHYDPVLARTTTLDPRAASYYATSPYAWCAGNPVKFVDPDGKKPRIYYEVNGLGHTFVTTGKGKETTVYTYGRYAHLGKNKSSARNSTPTGEGVLVILKGADAKKYIEDQLNNKNAVAYEFPNASDAKVDKYFQDRFNSSNKIPKAGKYAGDSRARVIDSYNIVTNNCTTFSINAISKGGGETLFFNNCISPLGASQKTFEADLADKIISIFGGSRKMVLVSKERILNEIQQK